MLTLYYKTACPFCLRARLVLAEKELPFGRRIVGASKPAELEEMSRGRVPVLVEDSFVVKESGVIAEYLEERFPRPALLPPDAKGRALVRMALVELDALLGVVAALGRARERRAESEKDVLEQLARWDAALGDLGTLFGMERSLADVWLLSAVEKGRVLGLDAARAGPKLAHWLERMRKREAAREEPLEGG